MAAQKTEGNGKTKSASGFTAEERSAMRERAQETRARPRGVKVDGEEEVRRKIAEMEGTDRSMAQRLHAILKANAPTLQSKTWYGMPAYTKDGELICFFRPAQKFKTRYATLGFSDEAKLDDGHMWPTDFALTELSATEEARIIALVKKAMGPTPSTR
jgi:uncharacterized protein YdhG (YjbR/CyaY superfamily)